MATQRKQYRRISKTKPLFSPRAGAVSPLASTRRARATRRRTLCKSQCCKRLVFEESAHRAEGNPGGVSGIVTGDQRTTDDEVC